MAQRADRRGCRRRNWAAAAASHGSGLAGTSHGQPAWPWALRLSGENLLIDLGQARRLALTLLALAAARRSRCCSRWPGAGARICSSPWCRCCWSLAPWPEAHVVLGAGLSHRASIARPPASARPRSRAGRALYAQHCVGCHGVDGRGQGPLAAAQAGVAAEPDRPAPVAARRWRSAVARAARHAGPARRARPCRPSRRPRRATRPGR